VGNEPSVETKEETNEDSILPFDQQPTADGEPERIAPSMQAVEAGLGMKARPERRDEYQAKQYIAMAAKYGLSALDAVAVTNEILRVCGKNELVNRDLPGADKALTQARDAATVFLAAGGRTPQHVQKVAEQVREEWKQPDLNVSFGHVVNFCARAMETPAKPKAKYRAATPADKVNKVS